MGKIDDLAREQIRKHGVDRYPTAGRNFLKLVEEVGELSKEINKEWMSSDPRDELHEADYDKIKKEIADVTLSLFNLSHKLYVDLESAVEELVNSDKRVFID